MDNWIDVRKKKPTKNNEEYLVSDKHGCVSTLDWVDGKWHSDVFNKFIPDGTITHWQPLPSPPEQKDKK